MALPRPSYSSISQLYPSGNTTGRLNFIEDDDAKNFMLSSAENYAQNTVPSVAASSVSVPESVFPKNMYGPALSNVNNPNFYASGMVPPTTGNDGFGFNLPTFDMVGNIMGGVGSLAKGYAAMKGLGLAEEELEFKRGAFERNFAQQKQSYDDTVRQYNNAQGERQAFVNATHANPSLSDIRTLQLA